MDVASVDVVTRDGCGHVVADEAAGGGGAEACHYGRGHVTAVEQVTSVEVAAQTPQVMSLRRCGKGRRKGGAGGRRCGGHGMTAEVVASVDMAFCSTVILQMQQAQL